jgi:hypothetical protein
LRQGLDNLPWLTLRLWSWSASGVAWITDVGHCAQLVLALLPKVEHKCASFFLNFQFYSFDLYVYPCASSIVSGVL